MAALLGVALSYAALLTTTGVTAGGGAEGELCLLGLDGDACGLAAARTPADIDGAREAVYATPAEVDCRAMAQGPGAHRDERPLLSGDCEGTILDLRYRVSRSPDSERPSGSLRSDRSRRTVHAAPAATGIPRDTRVPPTGTAHPMALYASHDPVPPQPGTLAIEWRGATATRTLDPPDRPPRV